MNFKLAISRLPFQWSIFINFGLFCAAKFLLDKFDFHLPNNVASIALPLTVGVLSVMEIFFSMFIKRPQISICISILLISVLFCLIPFGIILATDLEMEMIFQIVKISLVIAIGGGILNWLIYKAVKRNNAHSINVAELQNPKYFG
ncbi:hypothetical protein RGU72_13965 [Undibacterium sp. 5I1]|uniref:hypothetical protein n=1 Tax=unclassified Undibacterium TaxID=2630295 RepID=UPI002AB553B5|nr:MULTISPECIES: hypothetical protein [unclassified Undibacterium]MDY7539362.1 hypothetical protein [Undibacterium sp. 5I1]MEB0231189.1 hypothetical protein [Undibacterium sp. 10I3]MEB0258529.1 hypothetical protein [Undibacterium sp. 5I1]